MSTWNSTQWNQIPWNGSLGSVPVAPAEPATLELSVSTKFDLALTVSIAGDTSMAIDIGDIVRIDAAFEDDAGAPISPTTVTFTVQDPLGVQESFIEGTDAEATEVSTGNFRLEYEPAVVGKHVVRCVGTGVAKAAEKTSFVVDSPF